MVAESDVKQRHVRVERSVNELERRINELEGIVNVLKIESTANRAIVLQKRFGDKTEGQTWREYLQNALLRDVQFFVSTKLSSCIALLEKGPTTPFQEGNGAAHQPTTEAVDCHMAAASQQQPEWKLVWNFVRG
ncbi:hypothetical protein TSOC_002328 [Tetrabaena socialis]|uniref:Uncharacterized protein n=1 Tax=Tetrabaena socialis TaxID=47790 RepID=A0A2J8AEC2_9CHLO|nr:hypothetical protein TSOC_002328 [Tetrabaena socialis]|eukprot:PNH10849.1 hypothetical protein TSOC_002328 [Tetrabaena socialis]